MSRYAEPEVALTLPYDPAAVSYEIVPATASDTTNMAPPPPPPPASPVAPVAPGVPEVPGEPEGPVLAGAPAPVLVPSFTPPAPPA